jgi:hypothetical protein
MMPVHMAGGTGALESPRDQAEGSACEAADRYRATA